MQLTISVFMFIFHEFYQNFSDSVATATATRCGAESGVGVLPPTCGGGGNVSDDSP